MRAAPSLDAPPFDPTRPIDLASPSLARDPYPIYARLRETAPVALGRISLLRLKLVSRHADCRLVLTDERFVRDRGRARGRPRSGPLPIPLPKSIAALARSMIYEDDPEHRRHRALVQQAFKPHRVADLEPRVATLADELLDGLGKRSGTPVDLLEHYARVVPTRVIADLMGLGPEDARRFDEGLRVLSEGFSGIGLARTLLFDLRRTARFVREVIERKRRAPGDDLLTDLIAAEEAGDRLDDDELLAMTFLLIVAGFETTQHLIGNGVRSLVEAPSARARLAAEPSLWPTAVDELVRFRGPVHGTKPVYPVEDVELEGGVLKRGEAVMPLLGAANRDPAVFEAADALDVARSPNPHLGFGFGAHHCLGRPLALMETRVALSRLFERHPQLQIAVAPEALEVVPAPGWHRLAKLPVVLAP